jgi:mannose-6-phosphate isomerase-like protein (cupin superfamily)
MSQDQTKSLRVPKIVSIYEGDPIKPFGLDMRIVLRSSDTDGRFSAILAVHQPGQGPLAHRHTYQDEYFLIVEGAYEISIDQSAPQVFGPGTLMYIPAGHIHGFKNVGTKPAMVLDWSIPGGQDNYFQEISDLQAGEGFTGGDMEAVNEKHDTVYFR